MNTIPSDTKLIVISALDGTCVNATRADFSLDAAASRIFDSCLRQYGEFFDSTTIIMTRERRRLYMTSKHTKH